MIEYVKKLFGPRPSVVEIWRSEKDLKWYFHLRATNGKVMAPSQGYSTKSNAVRAIKKLYPGLTIKTR